MWWGSARSPVTNSLRTVFGKGMSIKLSPCTWPISRLPRQCSVPPKRCGWDVIPDQLCRAASILSFAPETAIHSSRESHHLDVNRQMAVTNSRRELGIQGVRELASEFFDASQSIHLPL